MTTSTSQTQPRPAWTAGSPIELPETCEPFCSCSSPDPTRETIFSDDQDGPDGRGRYRLTLWRRLEPEGLFSARAGQVCAFIGLNPSTATETKDDNTIRRCRDFATAWGFGWLVMLNLFAFRATDPREMKRAAEPIGAANDRILRHWATQAGCIVAAWGTHGAHLGRAGAVEKLLEDLPLRAFKLNDDRSPAHPLYQPKREDPPPLLSFLRTMENKS